jgi:hypothetical protein
MLSKQGGGLEAEESSAVDPCPNKMNRYRYLGLRRPQQEIFHAVLHGESGTVRTMSAHANPL